MASFRNTRSARGKSGAGRKALWLLGLALFGVWTSCSRSPSTAHNPLLVVLPQVEQSKRDAASPVGFAAWVGFVAREEFGPALRVAAPPEVVNALGLDSLASSSFVRRVLGRVEPDLVVLCRRSGSGGLAWRLESRGQMLAEGVSSSGSDWVGELFGALAAHLGTKIDQAEIQVPDSSVFRLAGEYLLGEAGSSEREPTQTRMAGADFLAATQVVFHLNCALEDRAQNEDLTEPLYKAGEVLRAQWHDTSSTEWKLWRGAYFVVAQRWSQAERWLSTAWKENPTDGRIAYWLSHLHPSRLEALGLGGTERALKLAISLNPLLFEARLTLADLYFGNRRFKEEERVLKRLLAINPTHEEALMKLGRIYMVTNDVPKVLATYKRVVDLNPANADAYYNLGIVYFGTGDLQDAEKLFQRAVELNDHPEAHLYLGFLYEKLGEREKAIAEYRKRIRMRKGPDDQYANEARKRLWELLHSADVQGQKAAGTGAGVR